MSVVRNTLHLEKTEHAGTASGVEKCLKMAIGLKNTAIDYQIVAF